MNRLLDKFGLVVGVAGAFICLAAGMSRLMGHFYMFRFSILTVLFAGIGMMVFACMIKLYNK